MNGGVAGGRARPLTPIYWVLYKVRTDHAFGFCSCLGYRVFSAFLSIPYLLIVALIVIRYPVCALDVWARCCSVLCRYLPNTFLCFFVSSRFPVSHRRYLVANTHTRLCCILFSQNTAYASRRV